MSDEGFYVPIGDGNHLLNWGGHDLSLVNTLEPTGEIALATGCSNLLTEQSTVTFSVPPSP
ncbi:MAG: hypothetical protein H0T94_00820 [Acidimicrobiia bacterium]|nr:hypothetical protein [Acidimicrobiia bacterium]